MTEFKDFLLDHFSSVSPTIERKIWSLDQLTKFVKRRAQISSEFGKSLEKLLQKSEESLWFEESSVREMYDKLKKTQDEVLSLHSNMSRRILDDVVAPLEKFHLELDQSKKRVLTQGNAAVKKLADSRNSLLKIREKFHRTCRELEVNEKMLKETDPTSKKHIELDKKQQKLAQDRQTDELSYKEQVGLTNMVQTEFYTKLMPSVLDEIQALFTQRLAIVKKSLSRFIELSLPEAKALSKPYTSLSSVIENISIEDDLDEYIQLITTERSHIPDNYVFEPFVSNGVQVSKNDQSATAKMSGWINKLKGQQKLEGTPPTTTVYSPYANNSSNTSLTSVFATPLATVMARQSQTHPNLDIPYFLKFAAEQIVLLEGEYTVGVFRLNGSTSKVEEIRQAVNRGDYDNFNFNLGSLHDITSAFKLLIRQLPDPLVTNDVYEKCFAEPPLDVNAMLKSLPSVNQRLLMFLIEFLRRFIKPEVVERTKMDKFNLSAVFAPCVFRCPYTDTTAFLQASDKEKKVVVQMLDNMDTYSATVITVSSNPNTIQSIPESIPYSRPPRPISVIHPQEKHNYPRSGPEGITLGKRRMIPLVSSESNEFEKSTHKPLSSVPPKPKRPPPTRRGSSYVTSSSNVETSLSSPLITNDEW